MNPSARSRSNQTCTPKDVILLIFYARRKPIKGRTRQQNEIFLAIKTVFENMTIYPAVRFEKHRGGPYSKQVGIMIDELVFSNHLVGIGKKSSNNFAVIISFNGIKDRFKALPEKTKNNLERIREELETHTSVEILNIIRTHFSEYTDLPDTDRHGSTPDWHNDMQTL